MTRMKLCRCGKLIEYQMESCDMCAIDIDAERADRHRHYDRHSRDGESAAFYHSIEWRRTRAYILSKYRGLDLYALFVDNEIVYADTVHHIIELRDDWNKRIDINNLFPLSSVNHNKIHKLYNKNKKEKEKIISLLFELKVKWNKKYK